MKLETCLQVLTQDRASHLRYHSIHFGWRTEQEMGGFTSCKAYLADEYMGRVHQSLSLPTQYMVSFVESPPGSRLRYITEFVNWWDTHLGIRIPTEVSSTSSMNLVLVTPSPEWLYGPPGILTHTFLLRVGLFYEGGDVLNFLDSSPKVVYADKVYWRDGANTLRACVQTSTPPYQKATWGLYKYDRALAHDDGFTHTPNIFGRRRGVS